MDRQELARLAHAHHPVAAPLADESVAALLRRALPRGDERVLELGCGQGTWLLRALATHPELTADGVDPDPAALTQARTTAERLGVVRRLGLHHRPPAEFSAPHPYDLVLCLGVGEAFGGLLPTLAAAHRHLAPGGALLLGEGYWQRPPDQAALAALGAAAADFDFDDLPTLVNRITAAGWTPVHAHTSTRHELDDYEWSRTGALAEWALDHPAHPDAARTHRLAAEHRTNWLTGYRDAIGFVTLLLRQADRAPMSDT